MVFVISRVISGVNERKGWFATNTSDETSILDFYNNFVSGKIDGKPPLPEIQTARITAKIGNKKLFFHRK